MPFTIRFTPSGADVRFTGIVDRATIEAAYVAAAARPDGAAPAYVLRDYTAADAINVSVGDVRALVLAHERAAGGLAPVLVAIAASHHADYGVARMWEIQTEVSGGHVETFVGWSRAEAVAWLVAHGVPAEELAL